MTKTPVEQCYKLSIYAFNWPLWPGHTGAMTWHCGDTPFGSIAFQVLGDSSPIAIRLLYSKSPMAGTKQDYDYVVALTTTPLPWGGVRYWFLCPGWGCERRVACLYLPAGGSCFACRHCYGLSYESRQVRDELGKWLRGVAALSELRERTQPGIPPPPDPHDDYLTAAQLQRRSRLTKRELSQLADGRLLLPDTIDGRYRPKLIGWGRKLAYLLHEGWGIDEIKAWSAGRWRLRNPRKWPPNREEWKAT